MGQMNSMGGGMGGMGMGSMGYPNMGMGGMGMGGMGMGGMGMGGMGMGGFGGMNMPQQQGDPKELYKDQLEQLKNMGFTNESVNIEALKATGGNV